MKIKAETVKNIGVTVVTVGVGIANAYLQRRQDEERVARIVKRELEKRAAEGGR